MKKTNRKGFTLVELVIVIAVIAILAGVLIGTFASVIKRANDSAEVQNIKNAEIAQKADDIIKKIEESNWFGWEDFETEIVTAVAKAVKENSYDTLDADEIKVVVEDAVKTALANIELKNTDLTKEEVKAIVENAIGSLKYEGVTEAQVRAIVNGATTTLLGNQLTAAQVRTIVNAANEQNLTAIQLANALANAMDGVVTYEQLNSKVNDIQTIVTTATSTLATSEQVQAIKEAVDQLVVNTTESDAVVLAKSYNILITKYGVTSSNSKTPYDVLTNAKITNVNDSDENATILLSLENVRFIVVNTSDEVVYNGGLELSLNSELGNKYKYWEFANPTAPVTLSKYSTCLTGTSYETITANGVGVDVGNATVSTINYGGAGEERKVVIRTNSYDTALTVNAPLDTIHHYGELMSANLQKVSSSSYYEHGDTNLVEIASGRLVITNDTNAKVDNVYLTATGENYKVEEVGIIIATQSGAKLPDVIRRDAVTETDGKVVCTIQTNVDANGEHPQKVDVVTIKGEDNVQEATNGYTNVADLTKMVLEAPTNSEVEGASEFIGNDVAVTDEEKQGVINEAKGTVIEVTFKGVVSLHTISEFRDLWNAGEFYDTENPVSVKLTGNVNMKKIGNWGPIGTWKYPFFGTFDGKKSETENYVISNLSNHANATVEGDKAYYYHVYSIGQSVGYGETYGFFGIAAGGDITIQNVTFDFVDINIVNGKNVGAVIGFAPKVGDNFNGDAISNTGAITLSNITVNGSVSGASHVSGMVGKIYARTGNVSFNNCTNNANISSVSNTIGGLAGYISIGSKDVSITNCSNTGNISCKNSHAAGLVGDTYTGGTATYTDCTNSGNVTAKTHAAGITYFHSTENVVISNLENSGNIKSLENDASGLFNASNSAHNVNATGYLRNSGDISGARNAAGVCAYFYIGHTVTFTSVTLSNSGNINVTGNEIYDINKSNDSKFNQHDGAGAIFGTLYGIGTSPFNFNQCIFINSGIVSARNEDNNELLDAHTGLVASALVFNPYTFTQCKYKNTGTIEDSASTHHFGDGQTDGEHSSAANTQKAEELIELKLFGYIPKQSNYTSSPSVTGVDISLLEE